DLVLAVVKAPATVIAHVKPLAGLQLGKRRRIGERGRCGGQPEKRRNDEARHGPNEKQISHGRVSRQARWTYFAMGASLLANAFGVGFIDWLGRCSRSIRKGETPEQRTEVFQ